MGDVTKTKCPECGSARVLPIVYGLLVEAPKDAIPGGCIISPENPTHGCLECGCRWRVNERGQVQIDEFAALEQRLVSESMGKNRSDRG